MSYLVKAFSTPGWATAMVVLPIRTLFSSTLGVALLRSGPCPPMEVSGGKSLAKSSKRSVHVYSSLSRRASLTFESNS